MKEKYFISAMEEYAKRLGAYCSFEICEIAEQRLGETPSQAQITAAMEKEAADTEKQLTAGAYIAAMCVEGVSRSSEELAELIKSCAVSGRSKICFVTGGSNGLHERIKQRADIRLSMSRMTFPHHLARVMLAEQIYRAFTINAGSKYHK